MPLTTLDPATALLVIDLQQGIVAYPTVHPIGEVVQRTRSLLDAFRHRGLPVVLVNVVGGPAGRTEQARPRGELPAGWADLIPELGQQPQDCLVTKRAPGAFTHTGLEARLKALGVTQVVVAGVATSNGVEATARQAYELGFHVALPIDAMTDVSAEAHTYSTTRVFPRIGETGTAQEVVRLVGERA